MVLGSLCFDVGSPRRVNTVTDGHRISALSCTMVVVHNRDRSCFFCENPNRTYT